MLLRALIVIALLCSAACSKPEPSAPDALSRGWTARHDESAETSDPGRFVLHQDGVEVKPGPNANLWSDALAATGNFRIALDVTHLDSGEHPHGAGLAFGGSDVHGDGQRYSYLLVRADGCFLIKTRTGSETPLVMPWTDHPAVGREDAAGVTRNRLAVEVDAEHVRFLVNGQEVHRAARASLPVDGRIGLRLVHDLHVKFGRPAVEALE